MPCYLFTYHTFGSWLPDHPRGYVRRGKGVLAPDKAMVAVYRQNATHEAVTIESEHQQAAIIAIESAAAHIDCRLHYIATDPTHLHVLVSWKGDAGWRQKRNSIKKAITIALKNQFADRPWLSEGASRKRVKNQEHFDYLMTKYLPSHRGWKWCEGRGMFK